MSDERIKKIVEGIEGLDLDKDYTEGGLPRVESLEAITGLAEIKAEERDKAWETHQAKSPGDDTPLKDGSESTGETPGATKTTSEDDTPPPETVPETAGTPPEDAKESKPKAEVPKTPVASKSKATEAKKPQTRYVVAEGKTLSSRKGVLKEGKSVTPECISGEPEDFEKLVKKGYIKVV